MSHKARVFQTRRIMERKRQDLWASPLLRRLPPGLFTARPPELEADAVDQAPRMPR
jgi:hypothetical protein